jgi:DNA-binding NarL/FixJ family response regulator
MENIRVVLFDDNQRVRDAVSLLLKALRIQFIGAYPHCNNLERDLDASEPDVVLMISICGIDGVKAVEQIRGCIRRLGCSCRPY